MNIKRAMFLIAGAFLIVAIFLPFLGISLKSPQYPTRNPKILLYVHSLRGDIKEWEILGRYIGINANPKLPEFDFKIFIFIFAGLAIMLGIAAFLGDRWKKAASIALIIASLIIAGWAQYKLYQQGHTLDPAAPLRTVAKPFTPPLFGITRIHKITIYHYPHLGSALLGLTIASTVYAAWLHKSPGKS
ncbi:MAG: hypothetical protein AB1798_11475 [Spirochaetota bacterium]